METANRIYVTRKFNCTINELFKWIIEPNLICQWFGPKHLKVGSVKTDLAIGGKYKIELLKSNDENFFIEGEYLEIKEPTTLVFSLKYVGIAHTPPDSTVKINLEAVDNTVSTLSLIQEFKIIPTDMDSRTRAWEKMFSKLSEKIRAANRDFV